MQSVFVFNAMRYATDAHRAQRRKASGDPYIIHPIRVLYLLADAGVHDDDTLAAAVLHDVVEDTDVTLKQLAEKFGAVAARIVGEVSNNAELTKEERKRAQVANVPGMSAQAKLVKLADMIDNLEDLLKDPPPGWSMDRVQGYFVWKKAAYDAGLREVWAVKLRDRADAVFKATLTVDGETRRAVPDGDNSALLEGYYESMK